MQEEEKDQEQDEELIASACTRLILPATQSQPEEPQRELGPP